MSCNILLMHLDSLHKLKAFVAAQAKTEIAQEVKEALQKSMESFGFIIIETLVGGPPADCSIAAGFFPQLKAVFGSQVLALPSLNLSIIRLIHNRAAVLCSEGYQMAAAILSSTSSQACNLERLVAIGR